MEEETLEDEGFKGGGFAGDVDPVRYGADEARG